MLSLRIGADEVCLYCLGHTGNIQPYILYILLYVNRTQFFNLCQYYYPLLIALRAKQLNTIVCFECTFLRMKGLTSSKHVCVTSRLWVFELLWAYYWDLAHALACFSTYSCCTHIWWRMSGEKSWIAVCLYENVFYKVVKPDFIFTSSLFNGLCFSA